MTASSWRLSLIHIYMVEHYERFGRILLGLVGTYGVYRTAVMTVTAVKGWAVAAEALQYNWRCV